MGSQRSGAIPAWVWLAAIVVGSFVFRASLAPGHRRPRSSWSTRSSGPSSRAGSQMPVSRCVRDEPDPGYSVLYPLAHQPGLRGLRKPSRRLRGREGDERGPDVARGGPRVLPRSAGRRRGLALLAALLAVALPSLAYTGTVMTENLFYPLFLVVALAPRPRPRATEPRGGSRSCVVLLGLAFATRVQARRSRARRSLLAPLAARGASRSASCGGRSAATAPLRGRSSCAASSCSSSSSPRDARSRDLLGAYEPSVSATTTLGEVLRLPRLARRRARPLRRSSSRSRRPSCSSAAPARSTRRSRPSSRRPSRSRSGMFPSSRRSRRAFSDRIEERNLFYVAPLLVIALLAWVERGAPRPRVLAPRRRGVSALLVAARSRSTASSTTSAITDTLMLLPFWSLQDRIGADWITVARRGARARARRALRLRSAALRARAAAPRPRSLGRRVQADLVGDARVQALSAGALFQGIRGADTDWIDAALPAGARRAFLWTGRTDRLTVNQNEFFNRTRRPGLLPRPPDARAACERRACAIDPETGRVTLPDGTRGARRVPPHRLRPSSPDGDAVAQDKAAGDHALARRRPLVVSRPGSTASTRTTRGRGTTVTYIRRRCERRVASRSSLSSDASLFFEPQTVVARSRGGVSLASGSNRVHAGAAECRSSRPATGDCRVDLHRDADRRAGRGHWRRKHRRPRARRALQPFDYRRRDREDRVRRQPALPPAARDRQLHPRLARRARRGRRRPSTRSSRSRRRASAARSGSARRSRASTSSCARGRSALACAPHGLEPARASRRRAPPRRLRRRCTSRTGCTRRSQPASARRRSTTSSRSIIPSGARARTLSMHSRKYRERGAHVRPRVRELRVTRAGRRADARGRGRADPRRASRRQEAVRDGRPRGRPRRTVRAHRRDARAAEEPRDAPPGPPAARGRARARRRRCGGLG